MNLFKVFSFLVVIFLTSSVCRYVTIHTGDEFGITINPGAKTQIIDEGKKSGESGNGLAGETTQTSTSTATKAVQPSATSTQTITLTQRPTEIPPTATATITKTPAVKKFYKPTDSCPQIHLGTPCP